ncbi:Fiber protein Fb17 [Dorcoceras hygrometricum]|uniref:Fiber protein Fb17 n=1 Tax=Dorcoceras hygrometricum TaxID=472368 RepID=A0A2Z7A854_9LAMI|nr:Fiber protein Fb17 [Dorcoceras hygrometricum]
MKIMKANTVMEITAGAAQWIEKTRMEYTSEDKKKENLDNVAKDILYKTLDKISTRTGDSNLETTSSSSSSESEQEEVHCLMANQTTEDEVFDFSNTEFTREDLINALNEMFHEYRNLSQTFEEIKAENRCLKNSSVESSTAQLEDIDSLKKLNQVMSSWTKSSVSLGNLHETKKPLNDKSGLGLSVGESSSGETSTQSDLAYDRFKKMNFVKASVIHDACESVKYDDQISPKLNHKGKQGIGYTKPENCKPSWLKNRLEKDKAKAGSKSSVPNQQRRGSTKAESVWVKVQPK